MLETDRLILRPMTDEDAYHLFELNSDPQVTRYTGDPADPTPSASLRVIHERIRPQFQQYKMGRFATTLKDGTFLGWCGLRYFPQNKEVDLGYRFHRRYWGQGYATEASAAALNYGFETLGLQKIIAKAMPENTASLKVMQKLGMTFRGLKKDPCEPHTLIVYDITLEEYRRWIK